MARILLLAVIGLATAFPALAQSVRVDGTSISVPPNLRPQWQQVEERDTWHTQRGDRIDGHFHRFVVRRFDLFRNEDGVLHIRVSWFQSGNCQTKSTPVRLLPQHKRHFLLMLFGRFEAITAPVSQVVTFCEFNGTIVPPDGPPRPVRPNLPPGEPTPESPEFPPEPPFGPQGPPNGPEPPEEPLPSPTESPELPTNPSEVPFDPQEPPAAPSERPVNLSESTTDRPAEPAEPPTDPGEPPAEPPEPPTGPGEPPVEPPEPPTGPGEPPVEPAEPPTGPGEPPVEPAEPPTGPGEPPVEPPEPPTGPGEPPVEPPEPPTGPGAPPAEPAEPTAGPTEPPGNPTDPADVPGEPVEVNPGEENDGGRSPLIPFIRMSIPAKNLLGPFAEIARQSFVDRYSTADCTAEGGGGGGDGPGEGPPGGGDEDDGNERPNRFGFQVRKFVSPAGSIQFSLANERDVCIEAENLGAAIRILRDRFRPHIRPTTQERVAYRFEPKPSACRPPERPEGPDDEELAPTPDPLETDDSETPAETEDIPV